MSAAEPVGASTGMLSAARRGTVLAAGPLLPFVLALLLAGVVLVATGRDVGEIFGLLIEHSFGGGVALANTLAQTTPVLLTGLATAFAFRSGVFNIGVEGSLYVGAFAAAWVGFTFLGVPGPVLLTAAIVLGAVVGAAWAFVPGYLKARWQVDEVVTTLMLNFVAINLTSYLVNGPFLAVGTANSMSPLVAPQARLGSLAPPSQMTIGLIIALMLAVGYWFVFRRTTIGYELRTAGDNPRFAAASGISLFRVVMVAMLVSGLVAGLAGAFQILGVNFRFIDRFSPGYGFTGIAVALLGRNTAIGCVLAALFFGALSSGGATIQLFTNIPLDLIDLLV
ncbi:MAG TPA: ABC transporter permease, partial [Actinomycetota bacterium]|nr:ABC transporter permease [Actinomycetota bacterium]